MWVCVKTRDFDPANWSVLPFGFWFPFEITRKDTPKEGHLLPCGCVFSKLSKL